MNSGGGSNCSVADFVEGSTSKDIVALRRGLEAVCMLGAVRPRRGASGMTLVLPGSAAQKEIAAKTDKVEKGADNAAADELETLLRAHILPMKLVTADDWMQSAVGSDLRKRVGVKSAAAGKVMLDNGAELERDADFRQYVSKFRGERGETQSVWRVVKGEMPTTGDAWEPMRPSKTGGSDGGDCRRRCVVAAFEASEALARSAPGFRYLEPFLARAVSLLNFLEDCSPDTYARALGMVSADPVSTLVILLEPYREKNVVACIGDELVQRWNGEMIFVDAQAEYQRHLKAAYAHYGTAEILATAASIRGEVLKNENPAAFVKAIGEAYSKLPDGGAAKQWRDEIRFDSLCWQSRRANGDDEPFACFECMLSHRERALLNIPTLRGDLLSATELFTKIGHFVKSAAFLYLPAPPEAYQDAESRLFAEALERLQSVQCRLMTETTAALFMRLMQRASSSQ